MFFDTHTHLNFKAFKNDADEVIRRSLDNETWMLIVGTDHKTSKKGLEMANKYEKGVYATIGLHPVHLEENEVYSKEDNYNFKTSAEEFNYEVYEKLAKFEKVVAIGEIGLDYYHINLSANVNQIKKKQQEIFWQQLELSRNLNLPAIIHCRQAHDDMLIILKDFRKKFKNLIKDNKPWGVMHCFSGDEDLAWHYFSLGLIISFTGVITFSQRWDDLIRKMPKEKFLIETDCPYMTPEPYRGRRNEPILVKYVAKRIAEIKNINLAKVGEISSANACIFFNV
ncbi:MAG: TatD family hydrolase [Patescibacteria group bacterium]